MKLNVKERVAILQMLPETGSLVEMVDIMEIVKKVRLEEEEKNNIEFKETKNSLSWNAFKDLGKDIEFKHEEISILKAAVRRLDEEKGINVSNLDICLKINSL